VSDVNQDATRALAAVVQERTDMELVWEQDPEDDFHWVVGQRVMNNDAKFDVRFGDSGYIVGRLWFRRWDQEEPYEPKPLGAAKHRDGVEKLIWQSIALEGRDAIHHPDSQKAAKLA
jgi:hypothetical protein